jgi:hypothetical protein
LVAVSKKKPQKLQGNFWGLLCGRGVRVRKPGD